MAYSLTYKDVDLGGDSIGFVIEENNFAPMNPAPRVYRRGRSAADGEVSQGSTFGPREGAVRGVVDAANYDALQAKRDALSAALSAGQLGNQTLTFDSHPGKSWQAKVLGSTWTDVGAAMAEVSITFLATFPWSVATEATESDDESVSAGGTTL